MISAVLGCAIIFAVSLMLDRSFDLTDESYYVLSIRYPWAFPDTLTYFGFVYHPLLGLVGQDITALRAVSLAITLTLAFWFGWINWPRSHATESSGGRLCFAIAAAALSLTSLNAWLPTPNYNILTVQALLIAAIGLTDAISRDRLNFANAVLIGVGGWLAFMAKPTSAVALAILVPLCLAIAGRLAWRFIVLAAMISAALLFASLWVLHGSLVQAAANMASAMADARVLQAGYEWSHILRIDRLSLGKRGSAIFLAIAGVAALAAWSAARRREQHPSIISIIVLFGTVAAVATLLFVSVFAQNEQLIRALPIAIALGGAVGTRFAFGSARAGQLKRGDLALILFFAVLPHVAAFGTNGNYWIAGAVASIFWSMAGMHYVASFGLSGQRSLWRVMTGCLLAAAILLSGWAKAPYRQTQSLWAQTARMKGQEGLRFPTMSREMTDYATALRRAAPGHSLSGEESLLDLTGHSPGAALFLNMRPAADYWLYGGYPGSEAYVRSRIGRTPCRSAFRTWLLVEPGGPRALNPASVGVSLSGYAIAARLSRPDSERGGLVSQLLLRPVGSPDAMANACQSVRTANSP